MELLWSLLISSVLFALHVFSEGFDVLDLGDDDFKVRINEHENALVMFYAPWCGHCKKLKPEFEKAATLLKANEPAITLAKVDCTENGKDICSEYQVSGYPTLKIFSKGELLKDYSGPREADGMVKYMQSQVGPSSKELSTVSDFDAFTNQDETVVVGFFPTETDLKGAFLQAASKLREKYKFAHTAASEILEKENIKEGIKLYRPKILKNKFEDSSLTYSGESKVSDIDSWIKKNSHGLVGIRTRENLDEFQPPVIVAYYTVDYAKNPKGTNYWRNRILKVAKDYSGEYKFAISSKDDFQHELNEYGFDYVPSEKPLVLAKGPKNQKYIMKDEFSVEALQQFVKDLEEGNMAPFMKSEEIPADNSGPVKVAVAKNFDDVVFNNGKDTLIEFYAPWCGHCKKLTPIFEELGEKMKGEEVAIVKMDATANDVPSAFDVRGFPTLYWLPKNNKNKPIPYDGGRDLKDFIKYIAEHATTELKKYNRKGKPKSGKDEL